MVKLNKIYTRTGDDGSTGLTDGSRVKKHSARPQAYGSVDELNSSLGLVFFCLNNYALWIVKQTSTNGIYNTWLSLPTSLYVLNPTNRPG